ncbi:MAG: ribose 5-phosphate isomerase B [Pirellulaceae bacterium]
MRIAIGSDHRGFNVKARLIEGLRQDGHEIADEGTHNGDTCDYPDVACIVSRKVSAGEADRGILICGTGIGMQITANKFRGVRAAVCHDEIEAEMSRRHNDTNVLCLSGNLVGERRVDSLVKKWLATEFEGGRHARRIEKIQHIERSNLASPPDGSDTSSSTCG